MTAPFAGTVIAGGGPAGCAAAIALARAGHAVTLVERYRVPREVVCGEFLGPDTAAALDALGLNLPALGAIRLQTLRIAAGRSSTRVALPFTGWGLPRATLDAALRNRARAAGVDVRYAMIQGADPERGGWRLRTDAGAIDGAALVLATGKHALRGHPREGAARGAVGMKLHLDGVDTPAEVALLHFPGGYAGLQPLPDGGANLCAAMFDRPTDLLARVAAGSDEGARLLRHARPAWPRPLAVAGVPYGWRHAAPRTLPGLYRVGDQLCVIPSLAGDGVGMALWSGLDAAAAIISGEAAADFHAAWRRRSRTPLVAAGVVAATWRALPVPVVHAARNVPLAHLLSRLTRLAIERPVTPGNGMPRASTTPC